MPNKPETPRAQCDIWLMIDDEGEYVATHDEEQLSELYSDFIGGSPANVRTVKLNLTVPLPRGVEVSGELPDDAEPGSKVALTVEG